MLRFQTYIYNPAIESGTSNVWIDAKVLSNRRQVMSIATAKVPHNPGGPLPYWTEIPLRFLSAGQYTLLVSATDRAVNRTASQQINFTVE